MTAVGAACLVVTLSLGLLARLPLGADPAVMPGSTATPGQSTMATPRPWHTVTALDGQPITVYPDDGLPHALVAGWYPQGNRRFLDATTPTDLRYVVVGGDETYPAPTGTGVITRNEAGEYQVMLFDGPTITLDVAGAILNPQWSPDGRRILFTVMAKGDGQLRARIYHVDTASWAEFGLGIRAGDCSRCELSWLPDGERIAVALVDHSTAGRPGDQDRNRGLQLFMATGTKLEFLEVGGWVQGAHAWSPDGRHVVVVGTQVRDGYRREVLQLVEVSTGTVVRTAPNTQAAYWVDNDRLLLDEWFKADVAVPASPSQGWIALRRLDGTLIERWLLPDTLRNSLVHP